MIIMRNTLLMLLAILLFPIAGLAETGEWQLAKEQDGIRVYTRDIAGSGYREFKGEMMVDANINQLLGLLDDTQACPQWMHNCIAPLLLSEASERERYTYMRNDLPWPFGDRELLVHSLINQEPASGAVTITLTGIDDDALPLDAQSKLPAKKKYERAAGLQGFWRFTPEGNRQHVVYQMHIDLGGSPAPALANAQIADTPLYTLINMRKLIELEKYHQFKIPTD
ncbi:START domain-containing protein [Zhongshania arctica]|uniref:START domain-containing protein n=1 Tax=Zhongshania arctica TaxID=3238302 RepID=A0ABV3TYL4_9GAMM